MPLSCWSPECAPVDLLEGGMGENQQSDKETYPLQRSTTLVPFCLIVQTLAVAACNLLFLRYAWISWRLHSAHQWIFHKPQTALLLQELLTFKEFIYLKINRVHSALLTRSLLFLRSAQWLSAEEKQTQNVQGNQLACLCTFCCHFLKGFYGLHGWLTSYVDHHGNGCCAPDPLWSRSCLR